MSLKKTYTEDKIAGRIKWQQVDVTDARGNAFTSDVPEYAVRHILMLVMYGDGTAVTMDIEKVNDDDTYSTLFDSYPVPPAIAKHIPEQGYSLLNPVITLQGGCNLAFTVEDSGETANVSILYWDRMM